MALAYMCRDDYAAGGYVCMLSLETLIGGLPFTPVSGYRTIYLKMAELDM